MLEEKDLQAIAQLVDTKLEKQKAGILTELGQKISDSESETMRGVAVLMEAEFRPQFSLLAEGQQTINEKLAPLDDLEVLETRVSALEAMVKKMNREIAQLKKAQ